jgi:hypothetical protein
VAWVPRTHPAFEVFAAHEIRTIKAPYWDGLVEKQLVFRDLGNDGNGCLVSEFIVEGALHISKVEIAHLDGAADPYAARFQTDLAFLDAIGVPADTINWPAGEVGRGGIVPEARVIRPELKGWATRATLQGTLPFGVSVRSMRRYAKPKIAALSVADLKKYRRNLRFAFNSYAIDCAGVAPTATERRKPLARIKSAAEHFAAYLSPSAADDLLTALDTPDLDARTLAYKQLRAKGHRALQFKNALRHWPKAPRLPEIEAFAAARDLADLDIDTVSPVGGRFRDPGLANLVLRVASIWTSVTGRTAGPVSVDKFGEEKKCPFADWLAEMHDLLGVPRPPVGRIVDIVRQIERLKKPAPITD